MSTWFYTQATWCQVHELNPFIVAFQFVMWPTHLAPWVQKTWLYFSIKAWNYSCGNFTVLAMTWLARSGTPVDQEARAPVMEAVGRDVWVRSNGPHNTQRDLLRPWKAQGEGKPLKKIQLTVQAAQHKMSQECPGKVFLKLKFHQLTSDAVPSASVTIYTEYVWIRHPPNYLLFLRRSVTHELSVCVAEKPRLKIPTELLVLDSPSVLVRMAKNNKKVCTCFEIRAQYNFSITLPTKLVLLVQCVCTCVCVCITTKPERLPLIKAIAMNTAHICLEEEKKCTING